MQSMEAIPSIGKGSEAGWDVQHRVKIQQDLMEMMGVELSDKELRNQKILGWVDDNGEKFSEITKDDLDLKSRLLSEDEAVYASALVEVKDRLLDEDQ